MFVPTRAMTWVLALVTLGLVIVALLAMTGEILDQTILGDYTGYHAPGCSRSLPRCCAASECEATTGGRRLANTNNAVTSAAARRHPC